MISVIGLDDLTLNGIQLFPNPTSGNVVIEYSDEQEKVLLEVITVLGQTVSTKEFMNADVLNIEIPGENGVYIVRVSDSFGVRSHRIVKKTLD